MQAKKLTPVLFHDGTACVFCATRIRGGISNSPVAISRRFVQSSPNLKKPETAQIHRSPVGGGWGATSNPRRDRSVEEDGWGRTPTPTPAPAPVAEHRWTMRPSAESQKGYYYKPHKPLASQLRDAQAGQPPAGSGAKQNVENGNRFRRITPAEHPLRQEATTWRHVRFRESTNSSDNSQVEFEREQQKRFEQASSGQVVSWSAYKQPNEHPADLSEDASGSPSPNAFDARRMAKFGTSNNGDEQAQRDGKRKDKSRSRKKLSIRNTTDEELDDAVIARMERREKRKAERQAQKSESRPTPIILPDFISISNLASALRVRIEDFTEKLRDMGFEDFSNDHVIGAEDAGLIAQEFNFEPTSVPQSETIEDIVAMPEPAAEDKELMLTRPPVITIMGHVDHGKTTLLDFIRKSSVAAGEHGGITQHIGAFTVNMPSGRTITFLDTPGHAAFLDMRARGANVTDIVILVVAADDSVKPQTLEAIKHAKAAGVPMIVAITKVDKEAADVDRVKRDLAREGVEIEDFGGDVQAIPVSGKTGEGIEDLEEAALALADVLDVRADTTGQTEGWVLESSLKASGKVATVLVRRGALRAGDIVVAGNTWAKIRILRNEAGEIVSEATPGQPVEVDGWDESPDAGAEVLQAPSLQRARQVSEMRQEREEAKKMAADVAATNEQRVEQKQQRAILQKQEEIEALQKSDPARAAELQRAIDLANTNQESRFIQVPIVLRADVSGSVEALSAALLSIGNSDIRSVLLRADVGQVSESDIELSAVAGGVVVNFGNPIDNAIRRLAEQQSVEIIEGNVIYRVTDDVKAYLQAKLPKLYIHQVVGEADVAQLFTYDVRGKGKISIAGCKVRNGVLEKAKHFKVLRGGKTIHEGSLSALKSHKKDVSEIRKGSDCGISFEGFENFEEGDVIQCVDIVEEKRTL